MFFPCAVAVAIGKRHGFRCFFKGLEEFVHRISSYTDFLGIPESKSVNVDLHGFPAIIRLPSHLSLGVTSADDTGTSWLGGWEGPTALGGKPTITAEKT